MRKAHKLAVSFGSAALILGGGAYAQLPQLGQSGQAGNATCPAGWTCAAPIANETGFTQREVTIGGQTYIQTMIDDGTGAFNSEDFVRVNFNNTPAEQGVLSRLTVVDPQAGGTFSTTSDIAAGWANTDPNGTARAVISMNINDPGAQGANLGFNIDFTVDTTFDANAADPNNANVLNGLMADQTVGLGGTAGDRQRFYTEIKRATAAGSSTITGGRGPGATWAQNEVIQVVWAAQQVAGTGSFGTQTVTNQTQDSAGTPNFTTFSSTTENGPWDWNAEFNGGAAPVF